MTKTNVIAVTSLTLLLNGCALNRGSGYYSTPQQKHCHNEAKKGRLSKVQGATEKGGIAGGAVGAGVAIATGGILNIPIISDIGAVLGALFGRASQEHEYNKQFKECMDYTTEQPEQRYNYNHYPYK